MLVDAEGCRGIGVTLLPPPPYGMDGPRCPPGSPRACAGACARAGKAPRDPPGPLFFLLQLNYNQPSGGGGGRLRAGSSPAFLLRLFTSSVGSFFLSVASIFHNSSADAIKAKGDGCKLYLPAIPPPPRSSQGLET